MEQYANMTKEECFKLLDEMAKNIEVKEQNPEKIIHHEQTPDMDPH